MRATIFILVVGLFACDEEGQLSIQDLGNAGHDVITSTDSGADPDLQADLSVDVDVSPDTSPQDVSTDTAPADATPADATPADAQIPAPVLWAKRFGGSGTDTGTHVVLDAQGNIYIAGVFSGSVDFGGGSKNSAGDLDIIFAKYDGNGNHIWSKRLGGSGTDGVQALLQDPSSGDLFLAGSYQGSVDFGDGVWTSAGWSDGFIVRYESNGTCLWSRSIGGSSSESVQAAALAGSDLVVTGPFSGPVDFGDGAVMPDSTDFFVLKLDGNGGLLWRKTFGGSANDLSSGVAVGNTMEVYVTGRFGGDVDFGGGSITAYGGGDAFVVRLDVDGNHDWSRSFRGNGSAAASSIAVDATGSVFVGGAFHGNLEYDGVKNVLSTNVFGQDIFVAKLNGSTATLLWAFEAGDSSDFDFLSDVQINASGRVLLTGSFNGAISLAGGPLLSSAGSSDVFFAEIDSAGSHLHSYRLGGAKEDKGFGVASNAVGEVVLTGQAKDPSKLGAVPLMSANSRDLFIVKLDVK